METSPLVAQAVTDRPGRPDHRAEALRSLRDELVAQGGCAIAERHDSDVCVEVVEVLGVEEGPIVRAALHSKRVPERRRILILRLLAPDRTAEFSCSDRSGNGPAARQAARRIRDWYAERAGASAAAGRIRVHLAGGVL
jgi:hypothetical protein